MHRDLTRTLIGSRARKELLAFLTSHLPHLPEPDERRAWSARARKTRAQVLDLFFRGHPPGLLQEKPHVHWGETLERRGYRIRKLRYEGYPGLWVPALLYEPQTLAGTVPAVLNPNGHHAGGKAMDYKQARCINLARRGMLALNTEFIGMGELRADLDHNRIAHLDLCGVAGIGVFYLLMKRGLDVLLDHPHADAERVAMTGLSGGGWQTALLSALDERVRVVVPVAGHSPLWQRIGCVEDIGDLEQCPADLCTAADYDRLTALFAPRPTLLIYNRRDDCCFQTRRTRRSIYAPVKPYFALFDAERDLAFHDNTDPGTHNYERDNREQLYAFLNRHFGLQTPPQELPCADEILTEADLHVGLPADNATLHSLAREALRRIRSREKPRRSRAAARRRLAALLRLPAYQVRAEKVGKEQRRRGYALQHYRLHLGPWTLPLSAFSPPRPRGLELVGGDAGRRHLGAPVQAALARGRRVLALDILGTGELATTWQYHMLLSSCGQRALGIQTAQFLAASEWACRRFRQPALHLGAHGRNSAFAALLAASLRPEKLRALHTSGLIDSLGRLVDWPLSYAEAAPLFCFGLLAEFEVEDLMALSAPVPLADAAGRGPLRS